MKCSLGNSNFLEELSSLSHSIVFLFALITEEGFLISPCYSLELCIQMGISFLFSFGFHFFLEKAMAPHSSTLAWKIPWTEDPGMLQSMGSWRVGHDWATSLSLFTCMHWIRKWQPTPVFLPGESQGRGDSQSGGLQSMESLRVGHDWATSLSLLFTAICKASSDNHFAFLRFFSLGMVLIPASYTISGTSVHSLQALYQI